MGAAASIVDDPIEEDKNDSVAAAFPFLSSKIETKIQKWVPQLQS
jgi:hypothetical protein